MQTPHTVTLLSGAARINELFLNVYPDGGVKIENCEFFISLTPEGNFTDFLKTKFREDFLNSPRLVSGVSWETLRGALAISKMLLFTGKKSEDNLVLANAIRSEFFSQTALTLKPKVGWFAIPLFTIEGHDNAYLTDILTDPIPLGRNYTLVASVAGLNLPETEREWFRVELRDWNQIIVSPDTLFRRILRKAKILS
ncbi:MAG: hypothetical protein ACHQ03_10905 [Candidatus Bathyarchaeia archaeon]